MPKPKAQFIFATEKPKHPVRSFFRTVLVALLLLAGVLLAFNQVTNQQVQLERVKVTVQNLPEEFENFSILHISDLQGRMVGEDQISILRAIAGRAYSCVVMTGDMVGPSGNVQPLLTLLRQLPGDVPKYLIAGDQDPSLTDGRAHDSLSVYSSWVNAAQAAGAIILDEPQLITRGKSKLYLVPESLYSLDLAGMQATYRKQLTKLEAQEATPDLAAQTRLLHYELDRLARVQTFSKELSEKDLQIVVTHAPLTTAYVSTMLNWQGKSHVFALRRAALVLAGHTCAGGWRIPGIGAIYDTELGWFPPDRLLVGMDYVSAIPQYISPGLSGNGDSPLPGRLLNPPTVTLIYLTSKMV